MTGDGKRVLGYVSGDSVLIEFHHWLLTWPLKYPFGLSISEIGFKEVEFSRWLCGSFTILKARDTAFHYVLENVLFSLFCSHSFPESSLNTLNNIQVLEHIDHYVERIF